MKKILMVAAIAAVAASTLFTNNASAQGVGIGPHVGYFKAQDADQGEWLVGGTVRLSLNPFLAAEAGVSFRREEYNNGDFKVESWPIQVSALVFPIPTLYALAGAGWYPTTFDFAAAYLAANSLDIGEQSDTQFGWHIGAGAQFPFMPLISLTGDIRWTFLEYEISDVPGLNAADANFYSIQLGVLIGL